MCDEDRLDTGALCGCVHERASHTSSQSRRASSDGARWSSARAWCAAIPHAGLERSYAATGTPSAMAATAPTCENVTTACALLSQPPSGSCSPPSV